MAFRFSNRTNGVWQCRLSTASPPFGGLLLLFSPVLADQLVSMIAAAYLDTDHTIAAYEFASGKRELDFNKIEPPVAGASVFALKPGASAVRRDRFRRIPGWVFATSGPDGVSRWWCQATQMNAPWQRPIRA
jgi:hypothetical protein